MSNKNELTEFLGGLIVGVVVGATITAVSTPYRGNELRREIEDQYRHGVDELGRVRSNWETSAKNFQSQGKEKTYQMLERLRRQVHDLSDKFDRLTNRGAEVLISEDDDRHEMV